jgi:hypothetical protein
MTFFLGTYSIYTNGFQIPHLKEKKTGSHPGLSGSPGSWVDLPGRLGLAGLLLQPVFY